MEISKATCTVCRQAIIPQYICPCQKPWEDPDNHSREAVLGRLVERQTEQNSRLRAEIRRLHDQISRIKRICVEQVAASNPPTY